MICESLSSPRCANLNCSCSLTNAVCISSIVISFYKEKIVSKSQSTHIFHIILNFVAKYRKLNTNEIKLVPLTCVCNHAHRVRAFVSVCVHTCCVCSCMLCVCVHVVCACMFCAYCVRTGAYKQQANLINTLISCQSV